MATKAKAASTEKHAAEQSAADQTRQAETDTTATENNAPSTDTGSVTAAEVTGDGTGNALPVLTHRIAATPERGFYRAGCHWPREGTYVHRDDFPDDQWAALEAEPRLVITQL